VVSGGQTIENDDDEWRMKDVSESGRKKAA
jgi:hypothetical protein